MAKSLVNNDDIAPDRSEASVNSIISIDLINASSQNIKLNASGFMHSLTEDKYLEEYTKPLRPKLLRSNFTRVLNNYDYIKNEHNGDLQILLSDNYIQEFNPERESDKWPNTNFVLRDQWIERMGDMVKQVESNGLDIEWDLWNEPNHSNYWTGTQQEFFDLWKEMYVEVRRIDSDAVIVGPSLGMDESWIYDFLDYSDQNNVVPNILSWHEMHDGKGSAKHIQGRYKRFDDYIKLNNIPVEHIVFNEVINDNYKNYPGTAVQFISNIEQTGIRNSAHSCWKDVIPGTTITNNCRSNTLNGLLTYQNGELVPRSTWWVYDTYGQMDGKQVFFEPNEDIEGIGSIESDKFVMLMGRDSVEEIPVPVVTIEISNLKDIYGSDNYRLEVYRIPSPEIETNPLLSPELVINTEKIVVNGDLTFDIHNINQFDAYKVIITPIDIPIKPQTGLGDLNEDGKVGLKDFILFIKYYREGNLEIDYNNNGKSKLDIGDFILFAERYREEN